MWYFLKLAVVFIGLGKMNKGIIKSLPQET